MASRSTTPMGDPMAVEVSFDNPNLDDFFGRYRGVHRRRREGLLCGNDGEAIQGAEQAKVREVKSKEVVQRQDGGRAERRRPPEEKAHEKASGGDPYGGEDRPTRLVWEHRLFRAFRQYRGVLPLSVDLLETLRLSQMFSARSRTPHDVPCSGCSRLSQTQFGWPIAARLSFYLCSALPNIWEHRRVRLPVGGTSRGT